MGKNDTRQLLATLRAHGFTVHETGNIWVIRRGEEFVAAMSTSPTDLRALRNVLALFRGIDLSEPEGE